MAARLVVEANRVEAWLRGLGCVKGACPNEFACIWQPPGGRPPFLVPNPVRYPHVPFKQMCRLADMLAEVMDAPGFGLPMP
jgi:hypothetical protein